MSRRTSRRGFLKVAGAGAAATAAFPQIVLPATLGLGGKTPPSERIGMGFIGIGGGDKGKHGAIGMGRCHFDGAMGYVEGKASAGFLQKEQVQILDICDVDRRFREHACDAANAYYADTRGKGTYKACTHSNDFRELLARDDIDAVVIATPPHWHGPMTIMACRAGKDVYVEKPMGMTIQESRAAVKTARRYGRVVQVGTQYAFTWCRPAIELALSGRLGRIKCVTLSFGLNESIMPKGIPKYDADPVPEYLDWDLFVGPNPWQPFRAKAYPHTWRRLGGFGWSSDISIHFSPAAQRGVGMDHTGPVEIVRNGVRYANGTEIRRGGKSNIRFVGEEGWASVEWGGHLTTNPPSLAREPLASNEEHVRRVVNHHVDFIESIRTRRKPIADAESHHRAFSLHMICGIAGAARANRWDPEREVFVGENAAHANRYLSRPYREPWRI